MDLKTFTARDAAKRFGAVLDAVRGGPVTINRNGRPRAVIVSIERYAEFEKARRKYQDEQYAELIWRGLDLLKEGKLGTGARALALAKRMRLGEAKPDDARAAEKLLERGGG